MLKKKPIKDKDKRKKAPKPKKPRVKKPLPIHESYQASHYKTDQIHTQGFFNPFAHNSGIVQSSDVPQARITGSIPYTSTFESYGITNKPPYFLESFIQPFGAFKRSYGPPQNIRPNYEISKQSKTATTVSGSNPMNQPKLSDFSEQGKPETVDYIDLVAPSKKGNSETQPDYIMLNNPPESKLTRREVIENKRMMNEEINNRIIEHKLAKKKVVKENILKRIEDKKRLRGPKENKEEL